MVFQIAPLIAGTIGSAIAATGRKTIIKNVVSGFTFGAPYAFGTYIGFPGNYNRKTYSKTSSRYVQEMPYGQRYQRKQRVWSRRLRRYIWVLPSRRYSASYSGYRRRPYRRRY